jgi:hypothetical protein
MVLLVTGSLGWGGVAQPPPAAESATDDWVVSRYGTCLLLGE